MIFNDWNLIANLIAVTALVPVGLFIYYYGTRPRQDGRRGRVYSRRWKTTAIGKVLMGQKIVWFLFLLFVLQSIFLDYALQPFLRIFAYTALVTQFWVVLGTLRHIQKSPANFPDSLGLNIPDEESNAGEQANQDGDARVARGDLADAE